MKGNISRTLFLNVTIAAVSSKSLIFNSTHRKMAQEEDDSFLEDVKKFLMCVVTLIMCGLPPIIYVCPWVGIIFTFFAVAIPLFMGVPVTDLWTFYIDNDNYLQGDMQPVAPQDAHIRSRG